MALAAGLRESPSGWGTRDHRFTAARPVRSRAIDFSRVPQRPARGSQSRHGVDAPGRLSAGRAGGRIGGGLHVQSQVERAAAGAAELVKGHGWLLPGCGFGSVWGGGGWCRVGWCVWGGGGGAPPGSRGRSVRDQFAASAGFLREETAVKDR